ncbi:MAG TPA: peptide chain release factor N(5)-glutamine methyltransferase [Chitinophagaceae bacterium]|nr:peptide chain release factor N(5)-glutamine methyltransferase [Chitinophagaceae bacterium]
MQLREYFRKFTRDLQPLFPPREATALAELVFREVTGMEATRRIGHGEKEIAAPEQLELDRMLRELLGHRPVQYVLGHAPFLEFDLKVNEAVLIPRPETGELVEWVIRYCSGLPASPGVIADLGTGSGCIAIALKGRFPNATVIATDCSGEALSVAIANAHSLGLPVQAVRSDLLDPAQDSSFPVVDLLVSNPPYVTPGEAGTMASHVLDFEPRMALFVPKDDPLIFYRSILRLAELRLAREGSVFVEINESLGPETTGLFEAAGWRVVLQKDLGGKDRMIRAWRDG